MTKEEIKGKSALKPGEPQDRMADTARAEYVHRGDAGDLVVEHNGEPFGSPKRYGGGPSGRTPANTDHSPSAGGPDHQQPQANTRPGERGKDNLPETEWSESQGGKISPQGAESDWEHGHHPAGPEHSGHGGGALGTPEAGMASGGNSDKDMPEYAGGT